MKEVSEVPNTKKEKVRGNPVNTGNIPTPPVPSQVSGRPLPEPPLPVEKVREVKKNIEDEVVERASGDVGVLEAKLGRKVLPEANEVVSPIEERLKEEVDASPKGTVTIKIFENSPYEVDFTGKITGTEVDMAWKAMMKEYKLWKHNIFKKETGGLR